MLWAALLPNDPPADEQRRIECLSGLSTWCLQFTPRGNRPTTSIFGDTLTPHSLGELIALYEHITFVEGTVWGIDSFDQWGVELGKQLAKEITPAFHDNQAMKKQDLSTQALLSYYRAHRR